ncbi:hypothetical protein D9758_002409 [Tetrapyrgos nigripes]|uniref:DNA mismatch repair proteins mutS family domain-containing protein n=1 Tax=Tetrapyrgos nigripes TaxID=182062 RepID=A0A8H5GPF6_9AGAR|nr:hypothetical protein D9758_002409 [Tetrapyrgos nigripes]
MVVLTRSFHHGLRRAALSHLSRPICRAIHTSHVVNIHLECKSEEGEGDASNASVAEKKIVKTKKKFSELPKVHILPDGTPAKPLEAWWSGDDDQQKPSRTRLRHETSNETEEIVKTESTLVETPAPKQRRKTKASSESDDNVEEPEAAAPKRRRRSKKTTDDTDESQVEEPKPKRTRKASASKRKKVEDAATSLEAEEDLEGDDQPRTGLARGVLENLAKFPHCLLLTRVGNFYESYFDQAVEIASILNIKLATRKWDGRRIHMCGFPLSNIDKHLKVMVQQHKRFVAMCEEFPKYPSPGVREFERRVVRIITPGTLIDESFLNQYENNYLLAVSAPPETDVPKETTVGLAWIDVSTGEFYSKVSTCESLKDDIARIGPQEIVLHKDLESNTQHPIFDALNEEAVTTSYIIPQEQTTPTSPESAETAVSPDKTSVTDEVITLQTASTASNAPVAAVYTPEETSAISLLTVYLQTNLLEHMPPLLLPNREDSGGRMQIDSHTIKALEIKESMREGGTRGSLLSVIKRTLTTSGTRLLARWLCSPSTSIPEIDARQSLVAFFCARPHFRSDLLDLLKKSEDAGRVVQKFLLGRGGASDLLALTTSIHLWTDIQQRVYLEREMEVQERSNFNPEEWASLDILISRMVQLEEFSERIGKALNQTDLQPSTPSPDGYFASDTDLMSHLRADWRYGRSRFGISINPEFSESLRSIHDTLRSLLNEKEKLEGKLQMAYNAPSLTLRSSPGQGMHVHLAKAKRDQSKLEADPKFVSISENNTTKIYFNQGWSMLGNRILETSIALSLAEKEAFETLRMEVASHASSLRRNARVVDELDVTLAFANLAVDMKFVRPTIRDDTSYHVVNGRHPTVELGLLTTGRLFTANSIDITPQSQLHVITGPNMAGKSTLLRQTALIAILAQTGSYVPADSASLGIVDKLFPRVGAKDDLFHDRSTFMVEMLETAEILRRATPKSLVIMDEVGRGTTVKDGLAIAFSTIHHLTSINQCRTLFATHFHELADMLGYTSNGRAQGVFENVAFYCTDVDETEDGSFAYSYRIRKGVNRDSHGLKVARLTGMPYSAVTVAQGVLDVLKSRPHEGFDPSELSALGQKFTSTIGSIGDRL